MKRNWIAPALLVLAMSGACAKPHAAKPAPPPKHNYVGFDLKPYDANAHNPFEEGMFVDSASIVRDGDMVGFDVLRIVGALDKTPGQIVLHYRASCGWRDISETSGRTPGRTELLVAYSKESLIVDEACAGRVKAAQGFASVEGVIAVPANVPPPPMIAPAPTFARNPDKPHPPWMETPHEFESVYGDDRTGNMLFLDRASAAREGTGITGLSLVLLGEDQRRGGNYTDVAVLRNVRYDCAARTMTITAEAGWNKYGTLIDVFDKSSAPRSAAQSPVIAAEIGAACSPAAATAQQFPSVMAAWAFARDRWPASRTATYAQCLWAHLPEGRRETYLAGNLKTPLIAHEEQAGLFALCAIPESPFPDAMSALARYAWSRKALAETKLDENALLAAWRAVPLQDRLRVAAMQMGQADGDMNWESDLMSGLARVLDYHGDRAALLHYYAATAGLDVN